MKLIELEPRWLTPNIFAFRCPCCRRVWLVCKNVMTSDAEQIGIVEKQFGEECSDVVMARNDFAWTFPSSGDFATMTVTPSIDASRSGGGHWHGFITNGECA